MRWCQWARSGRGGSAPQRAARPCLRGRHLPGRGSAWHQWGASRRRSAGRRARASGAGPGRRISGPAPADGSRDCRPGWHGPGGPVAGTPPDPGLASVVVIEIASLAADLASKSIDGRVTFVPPRPDPDAHRRVGPRLASWARRERCHDSLTASALEFRRGGRHAKDLRAHGCCQLLAAPDEPSGESSDHASAFDKGVSGTMEGGECRRRMRALG